MSDSPGKSENWSDEEYDSGESSEEEIQCRNMDPALAKLLGIIVEEQKETDWKPPEKPGLENSREIVSALYFQDKPLDIDYFAILKDCIANHKKLTDRQLDYVKNLGHEEKYELLQLYNRMLDSSR
jgi:hypothetical protein